MTFEQGSASPFDTKVYNQYLASWISVSVAGIERERVLTDWHASFVDAEAQGSAVRHTTKQQQYEFIGRFKPCMTEIDLHI